MKKLIYLLLMLPLAILASCTNEENLPDVDLTVSLSNVSKVDNTIYALEDSTIYIDGTTVKSLNHHAAEISGIQYFIDNYVNWIMSDPLQKPYKAQINKGTLPEGSYDLLVEGKVYQGDSSRAWVHMAIPLKVVTELPAGAPELGTVNVTITTAETYEKMIDSRW